MTTISDRHDRQIRMFGHEGQVRLRETRVAVVGVGGIGTQVLEQLAQLGVGDLVPVDPGAVKDSSRNRYAGLRHDDPVGLAKVALGERIVREIDPSIAVAPINESVISKRAFDALKTCTHVFGCVDLEGIRLVLTELAAAYEIPYIDVSSEVLPGPPLEYGGQVCVAADGEGCPVCLDLLDMTEASEDLAGGSARAVRRAIYGIEPELLDRSGPSVVMINGVVSSLAVMEFVALVTGIRPPNRVLHYRAHVGGVTRSISPSLRDCYFCKLIRGRRSQAGVERYLAALSTAA